MTRSHATRVIHKSITMHGKSLIDVLNTSHRSQEYLTAIAIMYAVNVSGLAATGPTDKPTVLHVALVWYYILGASWVDM